MPSDLELWRADLKKMSERDFKTNIQDRLNKTLALYYEELEKANVRLRSKKSLYILIIKMSNSNIYT